MKKKILKRTDKILTCGKKVIDTPYGPIILFGYINEPPEGGGGGGGGWDPDYPTYPNTGGGGGESTSNGGGGTLPSGTLSSDYQEEVSDTFWAPPITAFVRFTFLSSGATTPNVIFKTRSLGNYKTSTAVASPFVWRTRDVDLYASNTQVHVYFQTTDNNGGSCHWQAMHR